MKLFSLVAGSFLFVNLTVNGQVNKGSIFLGGEVAFSTEKGTSNNNNNNSDYKTGGIYISPLFGKVIKENLMVGTNFLFYFRNSDVALDFNDLKQWTYGIGFFMREYKQLAKTRFNLFLQQFLAIEHDKIKQAFNTIDKIETNGILIYIKVYPGISYKLNDKLQLETGFNNLFGMYYSHRRTTSGTVNPVTSKTNGFNVYAKAENLSQLYLGFRLFILKQ